MNAGALPTLHRWRMYLRNRKGFTLVELMVVIAILAILMGVLAVAVMGPWRDANANLDRLNMAKLASTLQAAAMSNSNRGKLNSAAFKEASGRAFWEQCFKQKLLDSDMLTKVVSLGSKTGDLPAKPEITDGVGEFTQQNCSYTSPLGGKLLETMGSMGRKRTFVLSFDSRNWNNYQDKQGVLVSWSDGEQALYVDEVTAANEFGVTKEEWANPAEHIIGRKGPWARTFEERGR
ncbi:MAG: prepilin-type N-terminal cleavage/methylation domain-containing protein [Planctomycetes bacterium]|nr:prepilin-type N-terminal cleavage/methylation domain-containing protein [Planctomycetota bacterium]